MSALPEEILESVLERIQRIAMDEEANTTGGTT